MILDLGWEKGCPARAALRSLSLRVILAARHGFGSKPKGLRKTLETAADKNTVTNRQMRRRCLNDRHNNDCGGEIMSVTSMQLKAPVYHRQRLLLFFLEFESKGIGKLDLQKLLMLYTEEMQSRQYAFVPFHYGCYSFLCADDLNLLEKRGWIESEGNRLSLKANLTEHKWAAVSEERETVRSWLKRNPNRGDALITETYRRYPYYAIFSEMKKRLLTTSEMEAVERSRII